MQAQARQWAEGHVHIAVEDRLIAQAAKPKEEAPLPEMKPVINPMSEKILARRGPIAPLEERLQVPVKNIRGGVGSELDDVTLAPKLSEGTSKLIASDCV